MFKLSDSTPLPSGRLVSVMVIVDREPAPSGSDSTAAGTIATGVPSRKLARPSRPGPGPFTSMTGASSTGVTVRLAVSEAAEKAVVPPLTLVSARAPLVPLLRSQARNWMALLRVPLKSAFGWK